MNTSLNTQLQTYDFHANGYDLQVRATSIAEAEAELRLRLPRSNVDYASLRLAPPPASSFTVVPLVAEHIFGLKLQDAQVQFYDKFSPQYARALEQCGGYTALVDGSPVACAGFVEQWHGRALAWALLGQDAGPHLARITRGVLRALRVAPWRRIEAQVDCEFGPGIRWAQMLGFEVEAKLRAFTPEGRDAFMYVRIKP